MKEGGEVWRVKQESVAKNTHAKMSQDRLNKKKSKPSHFLQSWLLVKTFITKVLNGTILNELTVLKEKKNIGLWKNTTHQPEVHDVKKIYSVEENKHE